MEKTKRFLYWLVVPSGYRFDATDRKRRWGIIAYWVSFASAMFRNHQIKTLKAEVEELTRVHEIDLQTIDTLHETINQLMDPKVRDALGRIGEELLKNDGTL